MNILFANVGKYQLAGCPSPERQTKLAIIVTVIIENTN